MEEESSRWEGRRETELDAKVSSLFVPSRCFPFFTSCSISLSLIYVRSSCLSLQPTKNIRNKIGDVEGEGGEASSLPRALFPSHLDPALPSLPPSLFLPSLSFSLSSFSLALQAPRHVGLRASVFTPSVRVWLRTGPTSRNPDFSWRKPSELSNSQHVREPGSSSVRPVVSSSYTSSGMLSRGVEEAGREKRRWEKRRRRRSSSWRLGRRNADRFQARSRLPAPLLRC